MDALVHCQECQEALRVPHNASGHRARCPNCGVHFVIPPPDELLEETISTWIEQDLEAVWSDREEQLARHEVEQRRRAGGAGGGAPAESAPPRPDRPARPGTPDGSTPAPTHRTTGDAASTGDQDSTPAPTPRSDADRAAPDKGDDTPRPTGAYPQTLQLYTPRPYLVVRRCDHLGVRFAFDAAWMEHDGFRASMPVRCVFSGITNRAQLIARPLVFIDRCRARRPSLDQLSSLHEHRELGDRSPRELMHIMGKLEAMPHPFAFAMPYYVSTRYAHVYLYCETHDRVDGGITCEVLIPDANTALDWLARVNGVTGIEYELLEHDASLLHGEAWRALSDETRQRISAWCKLRPREMLRLYLSDADFGKRDEGLGGIAVTDQRLVFCKYHHRGQVSLEAEDTCILARCEGQLASLTLVTGNQRNRMVKLHLPDLDRLKQCLDERGNLRVVVGA